MKRRLLALLLTLAMLFSMSAGAFAENAEPVIVPQEAPAQEEPVQEEPVQEEPVQEEPVQEEPVQEEPEQEEPAQEEPEQEEPAQEEPVQEEEPEQEQESIYPIYGACGEEAVWVLTENGDLTISGKGEMDDYSDEDSQPWAVYSLEIRSVTVEKDITAIGEAAFYGEYENLKTVRLPDALERIDDHAFEGCLKLEKIDLPEAITEIGEDAFKGCDALRKATFAGDAEAFAALVIGSGNEALTNVLEAPAAEEPKTEEPVVEEPVVEEPVVEEPETEEPAVEEPETEESTVDHVIGLIDAIGDVTIESESSIAAATEAYDALTEEEKALVSNYNALEAAVAAYVGLNDVALLADGETEEPVAADPAKVYVTINNAGHLELVNGEVTVTDIDANGVLTYDEALQATHAAYCEGGYATAVGDYGLYITKLWGVETTNVGYYRNGAMVMGLTDKVASGDRLEVMIYANAYPDTEAYAAFDKTSVETDDETSFELTLKSATFDENYNMTMVPCEGATITVDGVATEFVTDANGKATVTIATVGTHVVSATKTKTSSDGTKEISAITAPYCNVIVRAAVAGITLDKTEIALGEDESATITATLEPEGAAGTQIAWSSSDEKIATAKDGVVTASYMGGTATITAKAGESEATCEVTVTTTATDSGKYGNVIWRLRENGTLEFSAVPGSDGKMSGSISKWSLPTYTKNHNAEIKSIVVKEGVTSISNYAFYTMSAVTSVSLPSTLTSIGDDAFNGVKTITSFTCAEGCELSVNDKFVLKNKGTEIYTYLGAMEGVITIPDGVTKVGALFSGSDITGIIFPDSVKEISGTNYTTWNGPFVNCTKLESVTVPCDITQTGVFKGCTALKVVTFKEGVTTMADYTFNGCTALTTINLPKSLVTFNGGAFGGCTAINTINCAEGSIFTMKDNLLMKNGTEIVFALPGVEITGELVIPEGITSIAPYAYQNKTGITSVKFPSTLTSIGSFAFSGCTGLTGELVIPEGVTIVDREAFNDCTGITSLKLPSTLTTIGQQAFDSTSITALDLPASVTSIDYGAFQNTKIKTLNLPDGLNITANNAFAECAELTEVSVGGDVTGNNAFGSCTALTTVTVREGATSIGSRAFQGCTALTTVNLPKSLTSLNAQAFYGCTALKTINFAEGSIYRFQDGIIYASNKILFVLALDKEELTIADGITEIGNSAFQKQTILKKVTLPDSIVKIGDQAFKGCANLASINLPKNLEELGYSAFDGCTSLPMITIPASLKTIGNQAFRGCTGMKGRLLLPSTVTYFGQFAFGDCTGITSVYFEDAADPANTTYSERIFDSCTNLTDLRLPENLTKLNNMIYHCYGLRKLVLPESIKEFARDDYLPDGFTYMDLKGIEKFSTYTMSNMRNLKELYLSANLTDYPDSGRNCHPEIIYFRGTEEQWNAVNFASTTLENFEKYGTVIVFNYGSETGEAPKITKQPVGATYEQGLRPEPLTIEAEELEGAQYVYHWYCDGEYVASGKECPISTAEAGSHEYYCMVRCSVNGKYSEVKSDVVTVTVTELAQAFEGEGTEENPYKLSKWQDLERLSVLVEGGESYEGKVFQMTEDITLPAGWKPIGCTKDGSNGINKGANLNAFSGVFDGGNHLLTVPAGERPLFAYVNGATVRNLNIYGSQINGYGLVDCFTGVGMPNGTAMTIDHVTLKSSTQTRYSGLIGARQFENPYAGCSAGYNAIIRNCTIESGVVIGYTGESSEIGGFAGRMQGTVENCVNHGTVKGKNYVGGIIATIDNAMGACDVLNCTFDGKVIASGSNAGGIVGGGYSGSSAPNGKKITVKGCNASGSVSGDSNVGGILGGDVYVAQSWDNVKYSFKNNTFTGKVSGNSNVGAIIGFYDSLNRIDDITGNQYSRDCGTDKPVGKVYVVDTSYANPTAYGDTLYCNTETSVSSCPSVAGCSWKTGYNRTDDPLGADAERLWRPIGSATVDVTGIALNKKELAMKTGDTEKLIATVTPDNATDKTVTWTSSDETIATVAENGTITAKKVGTVVITAAAGSFTAKCTVTITEASALKVTISVLGDSMHGSGKVHTLKNGGLATWVKATEYSVSNGSTVWDVLKKCLDENNLSYSNPTGNYVSSVNGLGEFDNGTNSGWMYTLNGKYLLNGVSQQKVKDGDVIIFHYTDDYTLEDTGFGPDPDDNERVAAVEKKIDEIGDVTYTEASKAKIDAARKAYNDLTIAERKEVSNYQKLQDAEKKYSDLKKQDDQAKADAVKKLIDEMGDDADKIKEARKAYDDLTKEQKKLVTNYSKLTAAEYQRASSTATSSDRQSAQDTIDLIDQIGDMVSDASGAKIDAARKAYDKLSDTQKALVTNYEQLEAAEDAYAKLAGLEDFENLYSETSNLLTTLGEPGIGSVGGEWMVIGLARSGREIDVEAYLAKVAEYVAQSIDENERLHRNKSTDNSRIILALTALGMDVHDVNGHDLTAGLNDMAYIQKQGINGPIWALIALDANAYEPAEGDVTREALIQCILDAQLTDGGWAFSGENADSDMTGMALTALAPYYVPETETEDGTKIELTEAQITINEAIERGIECLSNLQFANGAFGTFSGNGEIVETSESTAQAIVALTALNIDPDTDERFVKNGNSALDALVSYGLTGGGFKHLMDGELDGMATEQGYYALTAYARYLMGMNRLYDMRDAFDPEAETVQPLELYIRIVK